MNMKSRRKPWSAICVACVFVIVAPLLVKWVVGSNPPFFLQPVSGDTSKEQTWITFFGAYIGAIIGALGAIVIMFRTLWEGRKDKIETRRYENFLYLRGILEDYLASVDASNIFELFYGMYDLTCGQFVTFDIKKFQEHISGEQWQFRRLRRGICQSMYEIPESVTSELYDSVHQIMMYEDAFLEFVEIINKEMKEIGADEWNAHRSKSLDFLYKSLVKRVEWHNYNGAGADGPNPFSFSSYFEEVHKADKNNFASFDNVKCKTLFVLILRNVVDNYQRQYYEIKNSVSSQAEALIRALKDGLDLEA